MLNLRKGPRMGRFSVMVDLTNDGDLIRAEAGLISADKVRRLRISGLVDSGATRLVIPESVAKQLGLELTGTTTVRYADGRTADRAVAQRIRLGYAGRESVFNAIIEPGRDAALIGAIVMEDLDLIIDCTGQQLIPRDPKQIISEVE